jgi:hypothetical protein
MEYITTTTSASEEANNVRRARLSTSYHTPPPKGRDNSLANAPPPVKVFLVLLIKFS